MLPFNITGLVKIHDNNEPDKHLIHVPVEKILEHDDMVAVVKGFSIIKETCINWRTTIYKIIDGFNSSPCTHICRALLKISKLVFIISKLPVK